MYIHVHVARLSKTLITHVSIIACTCTANVKLSHVYLVSEAVGHASYCTSYKTFLLIQQSLSCWKCMAFFKLFSKQGQAKISDC